jgi:hypothetical protein
MIDRNKPVPGVIGDSLTKRHDSAIFEQMIIIAIVDSGEERRRSVCIHITL